MLNPFPQLLDYAIFAPMLLRLATAVVFFYIAYLNVSGRTSIAAPGAAVWIVSALYALVALGLCFGYDTQYAALGGIIILVGHTFFARRFPMPHDFRRSTYTLVIIILLSLLLTGAGAFAFDIPL